jgi:hypothetical protein
MDLLSIRKGFPVLHRLLVLSRFSPYLPVYCYLRYYDSSASSPLSLPLFHVNSGLPIPPRPPSTDQVNISSCHLLSPMRTIRPHHINMLLSIILFQDLFYMLRHYVFLLNSITIKANYTSNPTQLPAVPNISCGHWKLK